MAFCIYCGKKLEEGETCNCQGAQAGQENVQQQAQDQAPQMNTQQQAQDQAPQMNTQQQAQNQAPQMNTQQYQENFNQAKEISGAYLKKLFGAFIGIVKQPVAYGTEFVASGDTKLGIGFCVLQALLSSLFALRIFGEINSVISAATSFLNSKEDTIAFSYPKAFFVTVIGSLIISFITAGLLYLGTMLFKGKTTYGKMLCVMAVRSTGTCLFLALSILLSFLNMSWAIGFFLLSWLVGLVFMIPAVQNTADFNTNRLPYVIVLVAVLSIVVYYFWMKIGFPMYIPSELKDQFDKFMEQLENLSTASNFLGSLF